MTARVAVDIGGTKIAAARVDGARVLERRQVATPRVDVATTIIPAIAELVADWLPPAGSAPPARLGVACTGYAAGGRVTAINPATLPFPNGFDLGGGLHRVLGVEAVIVNDALAATWGECRHGAGQGARAFAFLTISTGIGGGSVVDGRLLEGPTGFAGHVGHMVVAMDGPACGCGRRGCVEAIASGTALARHARAAYGRDIDAARILALAAEGDADCRVLAGNAARAVATLCLNLKTALDIERIALGGGVGLNPRFLAAVQTEIQHAPPAFRLDLAPALLGADAGLVGAAALADNGV